MRKEPASSLPPVESVEIALREFPKLSNLQIGKLWGIADNTIARHRPNNLDVVDQVHAEWERNQAHVPPTPEP